MQRKLEKKFIARHEGWDVYSVDGSVVRSVARPDEEFGNFATREQFPKLIGDHEIWLEQKKLDKEGVFFIANALANIKKKETGASENESYTTGLNVERLLREKLAGLKFRAGRAHKRIPSRVYIGRYLKLRDPRFPIEVWLVDGTIVRSFYKTDYTEGGHGYVYRWVPKDQIWLEKDLDRWELPYILVHEYLELRLMRDRGVAYDRAHEICSKVEFNARRGKGLAPRLVTGRRHLSKRDLPKLVQDEMFAYVTRNYLK